MYAVDKKKWRRQRLNFVTYEGKILSMAKDEVAQIQDIDDLSVQADTDKKEICGLRIVAWNNVIFFAFLLVKYRKKTNIYLFLTLPMTWYLMSRSQNRIWEVRLWYWFLLTLEWYIVFLYFLLINKHKIYDILHKYVLLNLLWCILENWLYLPVPKFEYSCMGLPRDCFNIPILHASSFKFLSFSELTALSSLSVADWVNNGHRKNCANLPKKKNINIASYWIVFEKWFFFHQYIHFTSQKCIL